jgi:hypothetical protein
MFLAINEKLPWRTIVMVIVFASGTEVSGSNPATLPSNKYVRFSGKT